MRLSRPGAMTVFAILALCALRLTAASLVVPNDHPLIHFHGRWDRAPGTWWTGSGFKINVQGLSSIALHLGNHTTAPAAAVGVSVNYGPFVTLNVSAGRNDIPLNMSSVADLERKKAGTTLVRINAEGWQNNRVNLESIELNEGARMLPYVPSKFAFQFIGDSLSAGQYLPQGVDQAWPFLVGEALKAEHNINAQPGAALSDIFSYGNAHGISFQFFRTEDTGYYYTTDHNFTTPWNFARDVPHATHLVLHVGANDAGQNISAANFTQVYLDFMTRLRKIYPTQPMFIFTPWGWPNADGTVNYYYDGIYPELVNTRHHLGDKNVFLVNTTGWVTWEDVFPDNQHPNVAGHEKIAGLFETWLEKWGLRPEASWATP